MEAAEILVKNLSHKKSFKKRLDKEAASSSGVDKSGGAEIKSASDEDFNTRFDAEVNTSTEHINPGSDPGSTGEEFVHREGKGIVQEYSEPVKTKKQLTKEEASLAEIARIQAEDATEEAKRAELTKDDELIAKSL